MSISQLDNLVKIGELKQEPPDQAQFDGFVASARNRIADLNVPELSEEGRFSAAYGAAHSLALAALRWHGYRSESRYLVFQCLQHTVGLDKAKWRVLDKCHKQRNLAEYEGHLEVSAQLLDELITIARELLTLVEDMGPVND
jgi:hypothetical protein